MKLNQYQKKYLQDKRNKILEETITVITITKTGSGNVYGEGQTVTKTGQTINCKIGWGAIIEKNELEGGYVKIGDCQILISLDDYDKVDDENIYLKTEEGIELNITRIIKVKDSNEAVLVCKRR